MAPARIESLGLIERACWRELERCTQERGHAWRTVTLATASTDPDQGGADARTVILREVDEGERKLFFYSDSRSAKVAQMRAQPLGTMVAWSRELSWQLRLRVRLTVHDSGLDVSSRWARVKLSPSAQDYLAALPPGTPIERFQPERGSREHFAVIEASVVDMDWLELHEQGHRRARLAGADSRWLTP